MVSVKASNKDLCFLKSLKAYENVNESILKAALQKFRQHLWYLTNEIAVLALFDDDVDEETKLKMVANLHRGNFSTMRKEKNINDFMSVKSQSSFSRLKIDDSFLNESPFSWEKNTSFLDAKKTVSMLRAVNDTAESWKNDPGLSWYNND
ncbi:hypothetical protein AVEN_244468-1 [Araneus ventricosus]|uniref:Uncharacterized protein n=1 Tax=Araneus ventricosus TaxID=182803 RepID=A0A4Y2L0K9_ARAVE|nr:hypothetical protein AVEN_244468-1 [Araneus ventricosus]